MSTCTSRFLVNRFCVVQSETTYEKLTVCWFPAAETLTADRLWVARRLCAGKVGPKKVEAFNCGHGSRQKSTLGNARAMCAYELDGIGRSKKLSRVAPAYVILR